MECSAALAYKEVPSARLPLPSRSSQGEFPRRQSGERARLGRCRRRLERLLQGPRRRVPPGRPRFPLPPECLDAGWSK